MTSGDAYLPGDADLSGVVDFLDLNIWSQNRFSNKAAFCSGDFDASGFIDFVDLNIWAANRFQGSQVINTGDSDAGHEGNDPVTVPVSPGSIRSATVAIPAPSSVWNPSDLAGQKRTHQVARSNFEHLVDEIWSEDL